MRQKVGPEGIERRSNKAQAGKHPANLEPDYLPLSYMSRMFKSPFLHESYILPAATPDEFLRAAALPKERPRALAHATHKRQSFVLGRAARALTLSSSSCAARAAFGVGATSAKVIFLGAIVTEMTLQLRRHL